MKTKNNNILELNISNNTNYYNYKIIDLSINQILNNFIIYINYINFNNLYCKDNIFYFGLLLYFISLLINQIY